MTARHTETAEQNAIAWARTALALGGATPWEWAHRVAIGEAKLADVPRPYLAIVEKYLTIKKLRESLL